MHALWPGFGRARPHGCQATCPKKGVARASGVTARAAGGGRVLDIQCPLQADPPTLADFCC